MTKAIFFALLLSSSLLYAQSDSTIYYTTATSDTIDNKFEQNKHIWFPEMTEVEHMWKLNLMLLLNPSFSIAYEKRLKDRLYYEVGIMAPSLIWKTDKLGYIISGAAWCDVRYYHGFRWRREKGKRAHSLFGNYAAIGITTYASNAYLNYENRPHKGDVDGNFNYYTKEEMENFPTLLFGSTHVKGYMIMPTIKYGFQRKLSDFGYIETVIGFGVGKSFSDDRIYQNLTLKLNLGFDLIACYKKWIK